MTDTIKCPADFDYWVSHTAPNTVEKAFQRLVDYDCPTTVLKDILEDLGMSFYPGTSWTSLDEVQRFYGLDRTDCPHAQKMRAWLNSNTSSNIYRSDVQLVNHLQVQEMVNRAGEGGRLVRPAPRNGYLPSYYYVTELNRKINLHHFDMKHFKILSPRIAFALAFQLYPNRRTIVKEKEAWNKSAEVARSVLEKALSFRSLAEVFHYVERKDYPAQQEPGETPPAEEPAPEPVSPQIDYAETLRKLFDSVLTLVEKQAEERGAEKLINQLKEAGKL